jgi:hypothetical protein
VIAKVKVEKVERKRSKHSFPNGFTIDKGHNKKGLLNLLDEELKAFLTDDKDKNKRVFSSAKFIKLWRKDGKTDEQIKTILDKWEAEIAPIVAKNKTRNKKSE